MTIWELTKNRTRSYFIRSTERGKSHHNEDNFTSEFISLYILHRGKGFLNCQHFLEIQIYCFLRLIIKLFPEVAQTTCKSEKIGTEIIVSNMLNFWASHCYNCTSKKTNYWANGAQFYALFYANIWQIKWVSNGWSTVVSADPSTERMLWALCNWWKHGKTWIN